MKNNLYFLFVFIAVTMQSAIAQTSAKHQFVSSNNIALMTGCALPVAQTDLDISNVRATMLTGGDMWWDTVNAQYEVPKGSGKTSIFAGALWIGGLDGGGQIRTACMTYRQTGNDFWPGPIDPATNDITADTCLAYDRHWKLNKSDVASFVSSGTTTVQDIMNYPGNNPYTNAPMAPYFDANSDGHYNYLDGDYPYFNLGAGAPVCCDMLHGDQCLWWVINDVGNFHSETNSPLPLELEVRCQAYAFDSLHYQTVNTTFYQYTMINNSSNTYTQSYFGQWVDPDLGNAFDDYVGCDVMKGVGYCYNGDSIDAGAAGYGLNPPAIGFDFLHGPEADANDGIDNNRNGIIDEPGEDVTMSKFLYYNNVNATPDGNPDGYADFYHFLQGIWLDGLPMTHTCNGRSPGTLCDFMFPGTTDPAFTDDLNESTCGNVPSDRRFVMSAGQFTMDPGEVNCITIGVVWARASSGGPIASRDLMLSSDSVIQLIFNSCFTDFSVGINTIEQENIMEISPNPFSDETIIRFNNSKGEGYTFKLYDLNGALVKDVKDIRDNFITVRKEKLKSGMYLFKLLSESGKASSGKLVIN